MILGWHVLAAEEFFGHRVGSWGAIVDFDNARAFDGVGESEDIIATLCPAVGKSPGAAVPIDRE